MLQGLADVWETKDVIEEISASSRNRKRQIANLLPTND